VAYPFTPTFTYSQLSDRLQKDFACKFLKAAGNLTHPQGYEHQIYYFERVVDDKTLRAVAPDLKDDEYVFYSVARSLCARLKIDPAAFGLDLG
jgi:hypothetical protein